MATDGKMYNSGIHLCFPHPNQDVRRHSTGTVQSTSAKINQPCGDKYDGRRLSLNDKENLLHHTQQSNSKNLFKNNRCRSPMILKKDVKPRTRHRASYKSSEKLYSRQRQTSQQPTGKNSQSDNNLVGSVQNGELVLQQLNANLLNADSKQKVTVLQSRATSGSKPVAFIIHHNPYFSRKTEDNNVGTTVVANRTDCVNRLSVPGTQIEDDKVGTTAFTDSRDETTAIKNCRNRRSVRGTLRRDGLTDFKQLNGIQKLKLKALYHIHR